MNPKRIKNITIEFTMLFFIIIIALFVRIKFLNYESLDYTEFLSPWYNYIKANGGFEALKYNFSNYTSSYLYLLSVGTYLNINKLYYVKYICFPFELLAAIFIMLIIRNRYKNKKLGYLAFSCTLFIPTVICNGAVWGQCDIIFTSFVLGSIYFIIKKKPVLSLLFYGIAFAFKLQAIFVIPLFIILLFKKQIKVRHLFLIPSVYVLSIIPNLLLGAKLKDLLLIYFNQSKEYKEITKSAPNIYQWYPQNLNFTISGITKYGIILTLIVVLIIIFFSTVYIKNLTDDCIIELALLFAVVIPFLLPRMHERYFFIADIISLLYAFCYPKRYYLAILIQMTSLFSYYPYLFNSVPIQLPVLALAMFIVLIKVSSCFIERIYFQFLQMPEANNKSKMLQFLQVKEKYINRLLHKAIRNLRKNSA